MDMVFKNRFIELWRKYFNDIELPITFFYRERVEDSDIAKPGSMNRCIIGALEEVRKGRSLTLNVNSVKCYGGRKYLGFTEKVRSDFEYFLSCGILGKINGERYKKSPALVQEILKTWPNFKAPAPYAIFKRWDNLSEEDTPDVVIFFAQPDVLSGLFTLANFDVSEPNGVFTPMGSGCSSIVSYPYLEKDSPNPRAVIGMFDPSARLFVTKNLLSFSLPMKRLVVMIENMEESFLITDTWQTLQKRIKLSG